MSELKLPRLLAAAKEFNIGQDTLIEFLSKKGFPKDDLKPTAKLTEDQYYALQAEFQSDKVAKNKADHVELPKGAAADKKVVAAEPKPAKVVKAAEIKEVPAAPVESVKIEAPEVEAPKVVNKIDLSLIDSSTRPKKTTKKAAEPTAETSKVEDAAKAADGETKSSAKKTKATKEATPAPPEDHSIAPENVHGEITNIQADKLTGPTILGKIDLPINSDTRPKPLSQEEKRVRKRIPVQGGGNRPQGGGGQQQQAGGNRPQGGGGYQGNRPQGGGYQGNRPNNRPGQAGGGRRNAPQTAEQKEIDQKAIQDKIKETQAKLSGQGGRGKSLKSKYRRARREEAAE
ncbi:MAG: translation initiation factor, partial [Bacteroidota bacterium]